jgi:putative molybdopterin biosynthesis protein
MIEKHYTTKEVAALLSVSEETVLRLVQRGELRAARVGSQLRYPESAVREMLDRNTKPASSFGLHRVTPQFRGRGASRPESR